MKKYTFLKNLMATFLLFSIFTCNGILPVSAAVVKQQNGFVEYQTEASINFNEIIEVVLTDKETGYYYTHELYRVNDYAGNLSVPFGTYSVNAKVLTDTDTAQFSVMCLTDEVVIDNGSLAVPIRLRVDVATGVETALPNSEGTIEFEGVETQTQEPSVSSEKENASSDVTKEADDHSLLISTLFFIGALLLLAVVYIIFKFKSER